MVATESPAAGYQRLRFGRTIHTSETSGKPSSCSGRHGRFVGSICDSHRKVSDSDFAAARNVFERYNDKEWSFTDCTSKVIMERLGVTHAFAFDRHFEEFGTVIRLPTRTRA
jgi:hypothetical protein